VGNRLTAAVVVKDEARYLPQWIEYHLSHGFDKFVVYNNSSTIEQDPSRTLLPYIRDGIVEVVDIPRFYKNRPPGAGWWAINKFQYLDCTWVWAASVDEYFYSPTGETVSSILRSFETTSISSLCVNWLIFNSEGPTDTGLVIERFTKCFRDVNEHIKSIARQGQYSRWIDPHCVENPHGFACVNELHHHVGGPWSHEFTAERLVIYHYQCMSRAEYDVKMDKGRADIPGAEDVRRGSDRETWDGLHTGERMERSELVLKGPWVREQILKRYNLL
jgi:hypothetical protein